MPLPPIAVAPASSPLVPALRRALAGRAEVTGEVAGALAVVDASGVPEPLAGDDLATTGDLLAAAAAAGVTRAVLVSSAVVYGARADGPLPLTEAEPLRPVPGLALAARCAEVERRAASWAATAPDRSAAVLRAAPVLGAGPGLAGALRPASPLRGGDADPPVQFVALDDLASAVAVAALTPLDGPCNVAAPGWLAGADLRAVAGAPRRLPLPDALVRRLRDRAARRLGGLGPHTRHPWVVATDRLTAAGWSASLSHEEAWLATHPGVPWSRLSPRRRQNLILGGATAGLVLAAAGATALVRGARRRRA